jgi:hypothetical protein
MKKNFIEYFRCPSTFVDFRLESEISASPGFFRFSSDLTCYGSISSGRVHRNPAARLEDISRYARVEGSKCLLPFDPDEVIDNFRLERYRSVSPAFLRPSANQSLFRGAYYTLRPFLPTTVRRYLQRTALRGWAKRSFPQWPVDQTADHLFNRLMADVIRAHGGREIPFIWFWPEGSSSCVVMTHDVETAAGLEFCNVLMDIDDFYGVKSSFQLIPEERYELRPDLLETMRSRGFEINVHDINHDGSLFRDRKEFLKRVARINSYGKQFAAVGYRSGALYRNLDWYDSFDYSYDMSVPSVGHLDPQAGGCCTTKPYFIGKMLEIPVAATQDYTLFHILKQYSTELWERQIEMVQEQNGMMSFIVHPDYLIERRARKVYVSLLHLLKTLRSQANVWTALPRDVNDWWRKRDQMKLVRSGNQWRIEGPESHRARVAYATLDGDKVIYRQAENADAADRREEPIEPRYVANL